MTVETLYWGRHVVARSDGEVASPDSAIVAASPREAAIKYAQIYGGASALDGLRLFKVQIAQSHPDGSIRQWASFLVTIKVSIGCEEL